MLKSHPLYLYSFVKELYVLSALLFLCGYIFGKTRLMYAAVIFIIILCFFFRNTQPPFKKDPRAFLSPSASKIQKITKINNKNIISTYLSPLDNHFMIAPCDCTVVEKIYKPQRNTDAECMRHVMLDKYGDVFYLDQIVSKPLHWGWMPSLLYDRCVSIVKVGDKLKQGERFGLIRFGSNMEYGLPSAYQISARPNEKLQMGQPLAKLY